MRKDEGPGNTGWRWRVEEVLVYWHKEAPRPDLDPAPSWLRQVMPWIGLALAFW